MRNPASVPLAEQQTAYIRLVRGRQPVHHGETASWDDGGMSSEQLRRAAQARGVAASYRASGGREVTVAPETIKAVLAALGDPPPRRPAPAGLATATAPRPRRRSWGFTIQLYALRSRGSWGHGDLRDLADLAAWSARDLGAGFVLINPLHAAEPAPPVSASPYLPMSRRFISPLYLRVEDVPEYATLDARERGRIAELARPLHAANGTAGLINRDAAWTAKRAALEILHRVPLSPRRRADYERYRQREGKALEDWATWCALAEIHGPDWRSWPSRLASPGSAAVRAERQRVEHRAGFHAWLQWLADGQLAAAQDAARRAGMDIGLIPDLAVGSHPGGADAWANQDLLVPGVTAGAPPDAFNPRGQAWGSQPWHPQRLAMQGYRPLGDLITAAARHAGALRVDHVMGLVRLWWIPPGMTPDRGTYVRYDHEAMVGVLARAAAGAGVLVIGEDLGTVDPWIRDYLGARGILGTSALWFERRRDGTPRPPGEWRRGCLATVGTHDMPTAAAFLTGEHVALRARLGVLTRPEDAERADAGAALAAWRGALAREGLLPAGAHPALDEQVAALYAYLARTPSSLIGVSLPDATGQRQPQNVPGTTDEYPNWQTPLTDGDGQPVLLEDLAGCPGVRALARAVSQPVSRAAQLPAPSRLGVVPGRRRGRIHGSPAVQDACVQAAWGRSWRSSEPARWVSMRATVSPSSLMPRLDAWRATAPAMDSASVAILRTSGEVLIAFHDSRSRSAPAFPSREPTRYPATKPMIVSMVPPHLACRMSVPAAGHPSHFPEFEIPLDVGQ